MAQLAFIWDLFVYEHLPASVSVHHVYSGYPWMSEKGTESPGAGVIGSNEPHMGAENHT